jgi:tetratricopeptide (TPR) repeat protein
MAVLAMKTKEIAFTLPLVVLLYELSFFGVPDHRKMALLSPLLLTSVIIPLGMLSLHKPAGEILSDVSTVTSDQFAMSRVDYLFTQFSVITTYLRLLVLPINQNLDYDYPLIHSLLEPRAFLSLFFLLALLAAAVMLWRAGSSSQSRVPSPESRPLRLASFGIFWFFITLSVESSVIPIRDVIFEHRVYLPSIGFFISVVTLLSIGGQKLSARIPAAGKLVAATLLTTALVLTVLTYARNEVWQSEETLWQDAKVKSPKKARPWNNVGVVYAKQRHLAEAIRELETAIRLEPTYLDGHLNLGQAYAVAERYRDAERELRIAIALSPPGDNAAREAMKELHRVLAAQSGRPHLSEGP